MVVDVVVIPGNGGGSIQDGWYGWLGRKLKTMSGVTCTLREMPDPCVAPRSKWIPFMRDVMKCSTNTIIVGHSSGAEAAMRYAEDHPILGFILVAAYTTDLGKDYEKISGYFDDPWRWDDMKKNTQFMVQFASTDDPCLPWEEQMEVAKSLGLDLRQYDDRGHFCDSTLPEVLQVVKEYVQKLT